MKKTFLFIFLFSFASMFKGVNAQNYHPNDIAVLQNIAIINFTSQSDFNWKTETDTSLWDGVTWDSSTPKRIIELNVSNSSNSATDAYLEGSVNVSALDSLEIFWVQGNYEVSAVNVSGLLKLEDLRVSSNKLTSLDVSGLTSLLEIHCKENQLTSINMTGCTNLEYIWCQYNEFTDLDFTGLTSILEIHCTSNSLTSIDISALNTLEVLGCSNNLLTSLDASGLTNLYQFHCFENQLTSLNMTGCTDLEYLKCQNNELTALDFTGLTSILEIHCAYNLLTSLDISTLSTLEVFGCAGNKLTTLDASGLTNLYQLHCKRNRLNTLNVTGCTNLNSLKVSQNAISNLDLSTCTSLSDIYAGNAGIETLNIENLASLGYIRMHGNNLDTLDITGCTSLDYLSIYENKMYLSDLIPLGEWPSMSSFNYNPQSHNVAIDVGGSIDFSFEAMIDGNATTFTLYDYLDVEVETNTTGLFTVSTEGVYLLIMENQGYELFVEVLVTDLDANAADVAILQAIIDNNFTSATGLNWEDETEPFLWDALEWDLISGRLLELNLSDGQDGEANTALSGIISVVGLDSLELFRCDRNGDVTGVTLTNLDELLDLRVSRTSIINLDLTGLTKLEELRANNATSLESVNFTGCDSLYYISMEYSEMETMDFSALTNLEELYIDDCEELISINLSGLINLTDLDMDDCYNLENLDLTGLTSLYDFDADDAKKLDNIIFTGCTSLYDVDVVGSGIKTINLSGITSLYRIYADDCYNLESINVNGCTSLYYLYADQCMLSDLDVTGCTTLYSLDVEYNYLTDLDVSGLTGLNSLNCYDNLLETLDVTGLTNLTTIYAQNNKLPLSQAAPAYNLPSASSKDFTNQKPYDPVFMAINDSVEYIGEDTIDINGGDVASVFTLYDSDDILVSTNGIGKFVISTAGVYYVTMSNSGVSITTELITVFDGPGIAVTITNDNFGTVDANSTSTETMTIYNHGNAELSVTDITLPDGFSVATSTYTIAAKEQEDVIVTFSPTSAQVYTGDVVVSSDALFGDSAITIQGTGITRIISLAGDLAFGNVDISTTADATLTISNSGDDELDVTNITLPTGFTVSATTATVTAGGSEDITVTFTPTDAMAYSGNITVTSNATSGTNTIATSGTGMGAIIALSGNMSFGNVDISTTADATLTISNSGNTELSVTDITLPDGFTVSSTTATVAASGSEDVTVTFDPTATNTYSGDITVTSNAISGTNTIAASGTGTDATGIDNPTAKLYSVYPNPASDMIYLKGFENVTTVRIYNVIGELVIERNLENSLSEISINELISGVYFIKSSEIKQTIKFIKE